MIDTDQPVPQGIAYDPKNVISIMVHIAAAFELSQEQSAKLLDRVEKAFRRQPPVFSKRAAAPVTLNAVAIAYGLLIGFGGYKEALKVSGDYVVRRARDYDPYADVEPEVQKSMHKRALANRRARR